MPKTVTFSLNALEACSQRDLPAEWFESFSVPSDGSWGVVAVQEGEHLFILDQVDKTAVRVVVDLDGTGFFGSLNEAGKLQALRRMHRIAVQAPRGRKSFPPQWMQYSAGSLITVFAYPLKLGSERVMAHVEHGFPTDVLFCSVTTSEEKVVLHDYKPRLSGFRQALKLYGVAASKASKSLAALERAVPRGVFDLDAVSHGAVTDGLTYTEWRKRLSTQQASFVEHEPKRSLKLRGPAGTGKTLAMELKVLHECYRAVDSGRDLRVLYVTHSWAVAENVQISLEQLDERGVLGFVDVFPLITLAQTELEQTGPVEILGDDSYTGKEAQLRALARLLAEARRGDWNAFEASCSPEFRARVTAAPGTVESNQFLWDLMLEVACVISANGIMPGLNAERRYRQIERRPWMMPLRSEAEKEFVFLLYGRLIGELLSRDEMTTDQVISDFLNMLSTFRWHGERRRRGYDLIFVDEFHLFNEQERMVFHHLTRDSSTHPIIFMAMDPRQSPAETYAEFAAPNVATGGSGESERSLGEFGNIDLEVVYRYTPEILAFLQYVDRYFPALDLGADWGVSVANAEADRASGPVPTIYLFASSSAERGAGLKMAVELAQGGHRVALLCLEAEAFREYQAASMEHTDARFSFVESRDDVDSLRYTKRSIVLSQPHYVAGLQFDAVILAGLRPSFSQYDAYQAYGLRRFIGDAYLGASRARTILTLLGSGSKADYPPVLQAAVQEGVLIHQDE